MSPINPVLKQSKTVLDSKKLDKNHLKLKKAGIRKQIKVRKTGVKARIYTNQAGETYAVSRRLIHEKMPGKYFCSAHIIPADLSKNCIAQIDVAKENRDVSIITLRVTRPIPAGQKISTGRGFLDVFIDEAKQIAIKEFKGKNFTISIIPANETLARYYEKAGFKRVLNVGLGPKTMKMYIDSLK